MVQQAMSKAKIISIQTDPRELGELLESFSDFKHDVMQMLLKQVGTVLILTFKVQMTFDLDLDILHPDGSTGTRRATRAL